MVSNSGVRLFIGWLRASLSALSNGALISENAHLVGTEDQQKLPTKTMEMTTPTPTEETPGNPQQQQIQKIPTAQGLKVRRGLHRHVVMITRRLVEVIRPKEIIQKGTLTPPPDNKAKKTTVPSKPSEQTTAIPVPNNPPVPESPKGVAQPVIQEGRGKDFEFLGTGSALSEEWILTSALTVKEDVNISALVVVPGRSNKVDQFQTEIFVSDVVRFADNPEAKLEPYKSLVLLRVERNMVFGSELSDVFFGFNERHQKPRKFGHCELISYYFNHNNRTFVKTQFPVKLVKNTPNCKAKDTTEACVKILLISPKYLFNPCFESTLSLGAPIMCDVALEAILYGYGHGEGCASQAQGGLRAFVVRDHLPTVTWLEDSMSHYLTSEEMNDTYYDMESIDYDYLFDFVSENFTANADFDKFFTMKPVFHSKFVPTRNKKCSKGDRWDSHFFFVVLTSAICKHILN